MQKSQGFKVSLAVDILRINMYSIVQDFKVLVLGGELVSEPSTLGLAVMQYSSSWEQIVFRGEFPISFTDLRPPVLSLSFFFTQYSVTFCTLGSW